MAKLGLLEGLKVVDLGVGMAAALVAKYLADAGAAVTRLPPAGGDPFEEYYPAYAVWHGGATIEPQADTARVEALLSDADICVIGGEDHPELVRRTEGAAISARHPTLVVLDITDGPEGTPYAGKPITDLLAQARSGLAWEQFPDRPILHSFEPGSYGAALNGLIGLLGALYEREGSGLGQRVTTSLFEGAIAWLGLYWVCLEKPTPAANFLIPRGVSPLVFKARDGKFLHLVIGGAGSKYGMYKALGIDDSSVTPESVSMPQPGGSPRDFFGQWDVLAEHVAKRDAHDVLASIWAEGLPAEPTLAPGDCWNDAQVARNGVIETDADGTRHVGLPFLYEIVPDGAPKAPDAGGKPLAGLRVIDCGAFVAGPLGGVALADLGAEVIKIENKAGDPNRTIFKAFTGSNVGKRSLVIDMKDPAGRAQVAALCDGADVVMSNFRPGVSARLGVDAGTLHARKPALIVLDSPAYGAAGPLAQKSGFDMVMQAWCGHEVKGAGAGNDPLWNRTSMVDFAGGMLGAVAMLTALIHRARTGNGVALESPLCNAGIYLLSELIERGDGSRVGAPTVNAGLTGYHPAEALYQARDGWVAIVARGRTAALALRDALGLSLGDDVAAWDDAAGQAITDAVRDLSFDALSARLDAGGVWVERADDDMFERLMHDEALKARGTIRAIRHPHYGTITQAGPLFALSRSPIGADRAAPVLGEGAADLLPG